NLVRAEADLQIDRKELDGDVEMKNRMRQELRYYLSNQNEFNSFRKFIFNFYLGASIRHVIQNAVQIPLTGISQLAADGAGFSSYKYFGKAGALAARFARKGTTGDPVLDSLLKQAERDGVISNLSIEFADNPGVELQRAVDSIAGQQSGVLQAGERVQHGASRLWRNFERFLMSTSLASERAKRSASFIANVLFQRAQGNKDVRDQYSREVLLSNQANFVGDKSNRPGYLVKEGGSPMHGPLLVLSALQSFTINHISQLYSFWNNGFRKGSANDKKALMIGLGHLLAFSGTMGFVGATTAEQLFEEFTGISLSTALRKKLVEAATKFLGDEYSHAADRVADGILGGIPGLLGIDASAGIGLGSPFFRYQAGQPMTIEQLGGAGVGLLGRIYQSVGQVQADPMNPQQWWAAGRTASPAFLSNTLRIFDTIDRGTVLDQNRQPVGDPLGIEGAVATSLGFTPMSVSKERQFKTQEYRATKRMSDEYEMTTRNVADLLRRFQETGDPELLL